MDINKKQHLNIEQLITAIGYFLCYAVVNNRAEAVTFITLCLFFSFFFLFKSKGSIPLRLTSYHWFLILFCAFCYISSLWSLNAARAIGKGNTMVEVIAMTFLFYMYYDKYEKSKTESLLRSIMWGGYFFAVYIIGVYGISRIISIIQNSIRIDNNIVNANSMGMCCAYTLLINIYFMFKRGRRWSDLIMILPFFVLVASASKKAYLIVLLGIVFLYIFNCIGKNMIMNVIKIFFGLLIISLLVFIISRIPAFNYINERLEGMILTFNGYSTSDYSTLTRLNLITLGLNMFKNNPIIGVGIDNATEYVAGLYYKDYYYLHNNFVELLADGGIIGFILYYWFYLLQLFRLLRYRDFKDKEYILCLTLLLIMIIMDYGSVSFMSKSTYIFLLLIHIKTEEMKLKSLEKAV